MPIRQYINNINKPGFFGGELEIAITTGIYHINIATFNEIRNKQIESNNLCKDISIIKKINLNELEISKN